MFLSYLAISPIDLETKISVSGTIFVGTAIVPAFVIWTLHKMGVVKDPGLNERIDRFLPMCAAVTCYCGITFYLAQINAPQWLTYFMFAAAAAAFTMLIVGMKWKISGHATGMGGLVGYIFILYYRHYLVSDSLWLFSIAALVAGAVCSARLLLERHTPAQVAAGFANGLFWILLFELSISVPHE